MAERFGPFDAYLSPYDKMRQSPDVEDRRDTPWPWYPGVKDPQQTMTAANELDQLMAVLSGQEIPPVTALSRALGARDIGPLSKEDVLKYLMENASTGPDPATIKGAR